MVGLKLSILLNLYFVYSVAANSCEISLKDFEVEPVYLVSSDAGKTYDLFKPQGEVTSITQGTQLLLLCAGKSNKLKVVGASTLNLVCKNGAFQDNNGKQHQIKDLQCSAIPTSDLKVTDEPCADGKGVIHQAGFAYGNDKFATVYTMCYNQPDQIVYYTHNVINGKGIKYSISESKRRAFRADGMGKTTTAVNKWYTTKHQVDQFNKVYGSSQQYVTTKNFLARGHLSPDADGITRYEQLATYYYTNVKPEFQIINAGNWLRAETLARTAAGNLGKDLDTYNGVMGVVEWADESGNLVEAYVDEDNKISVPKYYFKVILDKEDDSGIVMVTVNDPHIEDAVSNQFCISVCGKANMNHADFSRIDRGFTFCCSVKEFLQHYKDLPKSVSAKNLLVI